jgi:hypothetical protein
MPTSPARKSAHPIVLENRGWKADVEKEKASGQDLDLSHGNQTGGIAYQSNSNIPIKDVRVRFMRLPIVGKSQDKIAFDMRLAIHANSG